MHIHELKPSPGTRKRKKIVGRGRGSGLGKTSGRGHKGQRSRSGRWTVKASEGGQMPLIRRLPKVGFRSHRPVLYQVVNVEALDALDQGAEITADLLKSRGLINSRRRPFKILGNGDLKNPIVLKEGAFSKSAEQKIKDAGGRIELAEDPTSTKESAASQ